MSAVHPLPAALERQAFTDAMRRVAASVTVVTTDGPGGKHGATATAFSSVSADPPSVLVCLHKDSRISQALESNRIFCVNVLAEHAQALSQRFAGADDAHIDNRFDGVAHQCHAGEAPQLASALALHCQLSEHHTHASHQIFIGRVLRTSSSPERPLIYHNGAYTCLTKTPEGDLSCQ